MLRSTGCPLVSFCGNVEDLRTKQRIALDVCQEPAVDHRLEPAARAIYRHDLEIAWLDTSGFQRFDCADAHIIVVDEQRLEVRPRLVLLQERFHDGLGFRPGEVAGLGIQDLDVGVELVAETLRATDRRAGAGGTGQLEHGAAAGQRLVDFGGSALTLQSHVGPDVGGIKDASALTLRSTMMTGILAFLASLRTASQPSSTTGGRPMTSTPCWMQVRMAEIWFSCFCWASEKTSCLTPSFCAVSLIDAVLAVRQSLSAPSCG